MALAIPTLHVPLAVRLPRTAAIVNFACNSSCLVQPVFSLTQTTYQLTWKRRLKKMLTRNAILEAVFIKNIATVCNINQKFATALKITASEYFVFYKSSYTVYSRSNFLKSNNYLFHNLQWFLYTCINGYSHQIKVVPQKRRC